MKINLIKITKWNDIDWKYVEVKVFDVQKKISESSSTNQRRHWQNKLICMPEASLLAVRKVTQDNRGSSTPGVDNIVYKDTGKRLQLAKNLKLDGGASPARRVWIPKSNGKKRALGIPTLKDRAKQMLVKLALEPEWERIFETNSYGFRPGYTVADAKWMVTRQLQAAPKYYLNADIEACFDRVSHEYILSQLTNSSVIVNQIRSWLKAGTVETTFDGNIIKEGTVEGTPQGGIISPLLANIALHGLENDLVSKLGRKNVKMIRYADDIIILCNKHKHILEAKELLTKSLVTRGLVLSKEKTTIGHTMIKLEETSRVGFDFLGFYFRNVKRSIHRGVQNTHGQRLGMRQMCIPSREACVKHKLNLKQTLKKYKTAPLGKVIEKLGSIIRGWTNYFAISQATRVFSYMDYLMYRMLWKWSFKRYKSAKAAYKACWSSSRHWVFGYLNVKSDKIISLRRHDATKVRRHVKVKPGYHIYNGDFIYWSKRLSKQNPKFARLNGILKKQNYECGHCKLKLRPDDVIEIHHIIPTSAGGSNKTSNLKFIHGHCHDELHRLLSSQKETDVR